MVQRPSLIVLSLLLLMFGLCPILFFTDLTRNPYYTQIVLLNGFTFMLWIVWLVQALRRGEFVWSWSDVDLPLGALMIWSVASWLISLWNHPALRTPIYSEGSKGIIFLLVNTWLVYAAALRVRHALTMKHVLWVVYAVSAVAAGYGVLQYFGIEWIWPRQLNPYGSRPVSTFGNPNFMSSYLVMTIPVMMADYVWRITRVPRIFLWMAIVCCVGGLVATLTRSSWLGLLAALTLLGVRTAALAAHKEFSNKALVILCVSLFAVVGWWPRAETKAYNATVFSRIAEIKQVTTGTYAPVSQRLLIWLSSWEMVEDHPIVGEGWGCIELFYPFYQGPQLMNPKFKELRTHANNCHDEILEYWSQLGAIGLGLMLWLWVTYFRLAASIARRLDGPQRALQWALVCGVAGMLVDNLVNVSVHFAVPAFLFWWWVGMSIAQDPEAVRERRFPLTGARRGLAVLGVLGLLLLTGRCYCFWAGEVNFFDGFKKSKLNELPAAARSLEAAYEWHPLEVNNDYELANVYARMGDKDRAIPMYQHAADANAGYDEIYFNRATLLSQLGETDKAIADYKMTLAINPTSHDAYNALATLYFKDINRYGDAIEALYQQAVRIFPNDRDFWNNLGYLYTKKEHWQSAYDAYHRALEIDPEYDLAHRNIAVVATKIPGLMADPLLSLPQRFNDIDRSMDAHKIPEAIAKAKQLCADVPRSFRAWFLLGNAEFMNGDFVTAEQAYRQSIQLQPGAATTWQNLGVVLDRQNRSAEAEQAYRKALELDPKNTAARARLGMAKAGIP